ncbi:haloacid dehalogenase type II [Streptomyces argyrophyllae]|uniref:Haloacid dehalogenase type II n=1 Tax=Streptomyces argyrophylli TaxID=2726118 RepID=A0A6M4PSV1_9ACTN|nr:haloacid dehalogenase type II [Streptomyces argyrophyllae]QJS13694.1 haloacid dehalogenase type II [Streptomyces argyrophyllae]
MSGDGRPRVLVFDVNETLTDLSPLARLMARAGLPQESLPAWFAGVLRDGIALSLAGGHASFGDVARDGLRTLAASARGVADPEETAEDVLAALPRLPLQPDVPDGVRALRAAGYRLVTLTNGSAGTTRAVIERAGLTDCFETHLDVEAVGRWKPAREAYAHAVAAVGVPADEVALVSIHPWDIDGAARAGLATAWVRRTPEPYPVTCLPAAIEATSLPDLAERLVAQGQLIDGEGIG